MWYVITCPYDPSSLVPYRTCNNNERSFLFGSYVEPETSPSNFFPSIRAWRDVSEQLLIYFRRFQPLQSISCEVKMCSFLTFFFFNFDYFGTLDRQRLNPPLMGWDGRVHATPFSHHQTSPRVIDTILLTIFFSSIVSYSIGIAGWMAAYLFLPFFSLSLSALLCSPVFWNSLKFERAE